MKFRKILWKILGSVHSLVLEVRRVGGKDMLPKLPGSQDNPSHNTSNGNAPITSYDQEACS